MKSLNYYLSTFIKTSIGLSVLLLIQSCQDQKSSSFEIENSNTDIETEVKKRLKPYMMFTQNLI